MEKTTLLPITPISKKALFIVSVLLLLFFLPVIGQADEPSGELGMPSLLKKGLEELVEIDVSIATGTPKPLNLAPSVATVITAQDIEDMGATTVDEVLETVPGLHVSASFGLMAPVYSIRGIHTGLNPQVLVLINGLPITYLYNGRRTFGLHLPAYDISRIEVVRGPGSAVYGADAFAGTINVITKDSDEIGGTKATVRVGSFDSYSAELQHGRTYGDLRVAFDFGYRKSRGDKDRKVDSDLQTTFDNMFNIPLGLQPASLAPGTLNTQYEIFDADIDLRYDKWTFRVYGYLLNDGGVGPSGTQVVDPAGRCNTSLLLSDITYQTKDLLADWDLSARLSYLYQHEDTRFVLFPPGAVVPIGADGNVGTSPFAGFALYTDGLTGEPILTDHQAAIDLTALYTGIKNHRVRFGTGFRYQKEYTESYQNFGPGVLDTAAFLPPPDLNPVNGSLTHLTGGPYIFLPDNDRKIWYFSLQDEWAFAKKWELTAGARYDDYSDFGVTINPRLALVWMTREDLTLKLLYGRAFRPPAFSELYNKNNPSALGNPDVDPETIDTYEIAFDYRPTRAIRLGLNLFEYRISGLIDYVADPAPATSKTAQNARDQKGHGFEVEADWLVTDTLRLRGNIAYQRSKDKKTGETVPDAPGLQFYANAHWKFLPEWSLDGQYFWIGDRHRAKIDPRPKIKDYDLVNLTLRRKNILKHWEFALAVRNLFDEDVREPSQPSIPNDYPMEGRSLWAELRYTF